MKQYKHFYLILLVFIFVFSFNINVNAGFELDGNILTILFNSAVETDRFQSYNWHQFSKDNPKKINQFKQTYELNPLVAETSREEFDNRVDVGKSFVNSLPETMESGLGWLLYSGVTLIEVINVIDNDAGIRYMQEWDQKTDRVFVVDLKFKF